MTERITISLLAATLGLLLAPLTGCIPRKGQLSLFGEAGKLADRSASGEAPAGRSEARPSSNEAGGSGPDGATTAKPDTAPPAPTKPQPPFGSAVGVTADNFTGIQDCAGKLYTLHDYFGKQKGVLIAMMSPS